MTAICNFHYSLWYQPTQVWKTTFKTIDQLSCFMGHPVLNIEIEYVENNSGNIHSALQYYTGLPKKDETSETIVQNLYCLFIYISTPVNCFFSLPCQ